MLSILKNNLLHLYIFHESLNFLPNGFSHSKCAAKLRYGMLYSLVITGLNNQNR